MLCNTLSKQFCSFTSELCWYFMANTTWFWWSCFIYVFICFLVSIYYFFFNGDSLLSCFRHSFLTKDNYFFFNLEDIWRIGEQFLSFCIPTDTCFLLTEGLKPDVCGVGGPRSPIAAHGSTTWQVMKDLTMSAILPVLQQDYPRKVINRIKWFNPAASSRYLGQSCRAPVC